ncbi:hypothetical protein [Ruegeria hyattellae]|uniref:hypothetical protein n=1 Tax=Ruegeria hyattellae TaxID=3233337 RepID=UPI00355BD797
MSVKNVIGSAALLTWLTAGAGIASEVIPSADATFSKWGEEEGWTIYVDESRGSCLIEREDENSNVVQMGLTEDQKFGYLGVFTQADLKFKDGKVHLLLDEKPYYADARAKTKNLAEGYKGGYILANNPNFVDDVMKRYTMIVMPEDKAAFQVSLDGTFKAIEAARKCNVEQAN